MTLSEIYLTLVQFFIAGIIVNLAVAVLTIIAAGGEFLRCGAPFDSTFEAFYEFYLEGFLPTMFILLITTFILKIIGGF